MDLGIVERITRKRRPMKNLATAFVIVLGASSVVFLVLSTFGIQDKIAGPISSTLFGAITYVSQVLDKGKSGLALFPAGVVDFSKFFIKFYLLIGYVSILLFSVMELSSAIGGLVAAAFATELSNLHPILVGSSLGINFVSVFLLGRWVGKRSSRLPFLVIIVSCVIAEAIGHASDFVMLPDDDYEQVVGLSKNLVNLSLMILGGSILFSVVGLIGCWRGRARRMAEYLNYLLKRIPSATRDTLVAIAYEEARRLSAAPDAR